MTFAHWVVVCSAVIVLAVGGAFGCGGGDDDNGDDAVDTVDAAPPDAAAVDMAACSELPAIVRQAAVGDGEGVQLCLNPGASVCSLVAGDCASDGVVSFVATASDHYMSSAANWTIPTVTSGEYDAGTERWQGLEEGVDITFTLQGPDFVIREGVFRYSGATWTFASFGEQ